MGTLTTGTIPKAIGPAQVDDGYTVATTVGATGVDTAVVTEQGIREMHTAGPEIDGLSEIGAALVDADTFPVDDGDSGTNKKSLVSRIFTYVTTKIQALANKATPVDADILMIQDSAASNALKELTLTNYWANYLAAKAKLIKLDDFAATDDNTDLNASTTAHGLLPKLSDAATDFLNGTGAYSVPTIASTNANAVNVQEISGATFDDVQALINNLHSSTIITGAGLTNNGNGTITIAAATGYTKTSDSHVASLSSFDIGANAAMPLVDDSLNYIYVDYGGGTPAYVATTTEADMNSHEKWQIGLAFRDGSTAHVLGVGHHLQDGVAHTDDMLTSIFGPTRATGLVTTESGTRNIGVTAGTAYDGLTKIALNAYASNSVDFTYWYKPAGSWVSAANSIIDNTQYNDFGAGLANVSNNKYGVHWVFMHFENDVHIVYGVGDYTLTEAENASTPSSLPGLIDNFAIPIAKIIVLKSATNLLSIENPFSTAFTHSAVSNHDDLGGIQGGAADDYFHLTSARHSVLSDIGDLTPAANTIPYWNGANAAASIQLLDEDDMSSDDANAIPTQQSVKAYTDTKYETVWIGAGAMTPGTTAGAEAVTNEFATNDITLDVMAFDGSAANEHAYWNLSMPDSWDRSTIKAKVYWMPGAGTASAADDVEFEISAGSLSNDDVVDHDFSAGVVSIADAVIATTDIHITAASAAITVQGSPALEDWIQFKLTRDYDHGGTSMTEDAWVFGVMIQYKTTLNPAIW